MGKIRIVDRIQEMLFELEVSSVMWKDFYTLHPHDLMSQVRKVMQRNRNTLVPIVLDKKLIGTLTIDNYIKWLNGPKEDKPVTRFMNVDNITLHPQEPVVSALRKMSDSKSVRVAVVDPETYELVGVVCRCNLFEDVLSKIDVIYKEEEVRQYRASHIFEDLKADSVNISMKFHVANTPMEFGGEIASSLRTALQNLGLEGDMIRRAGIASYEAEMNLLAYAGGGDFFIDVNPEHIRIVITDKGPGIPDIKQAMEPGYSTAPDWVRELGFGAGMGLNNIDNCSDKFIITSEVGVGTVLEIIIDLEKV
ncbi:MAG: CBS domain-containing protein [Spirochaetaceae bacterium]|jgi:anti-sigma regulatory factor (Ser/Thr protein kinase)/CBS domain-containing protein|nr:CBS domain-containing protein [Spirochaetaceae bacterium]